MSNPFAIRNIDDLQERVMYCDRLDTGDIVEFYDTETLTVRKMVVSMFVKNIGNSRLPAVIGWVYSEDGFINEAAITITFIKSDEKR